MARGRKSTFSAKVAAEICERIASGQSLREVCRDEGMPPESTVRDWAVNDIQGFSAQFARATSARAERWAEEILEISDDGSNDWMDRQVGEDETVRVVDHEHVQRSKLRVDARKWLMSKMLPKKYGDRVEIEHGGAVKVVSEMTDDELRAIAAQGLGKDKDASV